MNPNDVDRYRTRELNAWDPGYQVIPWERLPQEARDAWLACAGGGEA